MPQYPRTARNHSYRTMENIARARALQMEGIWDTIGNAVNGAITSAGKDSKGNVGIGSSLAGAAAAGAIGIVGGLIEGAIAGSSKPKPTFQTPEEPPPPAPVPTNTTPTPRRVVQPVRTTSRTPVVPVRTMAATGPAGGTFPILPVAAVAAAGLGFLAWKKGWI